jgi:hypothetical protein
MKMNEQKIDPGSFFLFPRLSSPVWTLIFNTKWHCISFPCLVLVSCALSVLDPIYPQTAHY